VGVRRYLFLAAVLLLVAPLAAARAGERALVSVEAPPPGTVAALHGDGVMVVRDLGRYLLAVASPSDLARLDARGLRWRVLDESVEGRTYYTVVTRGRPLDALLPAGHMLRSDDYETVVRAAPGEAERIAEAGFAIARVFLRPVRPSRPEPRGAALRSLTPDPLVADIVQSVDGAQVDASVQRLQDFLTRYCTTDSCYAAADWIRSRFESFGLDSVAFHQWSMLYAPNVVGVLTGRDSPDEIIVIGAHYDSITPDHADCPGADDNASGASVVLECARVLSGYEFDRTIVFVTFGAEELGLYGSEAWASAAAARGDRIVAMVNLDMVGYLSPLDVMDLDLISDIGSTWLADVARDVAATYVTELPVVDGALPAGANSDHASFWAQGYDAIQFFEDTGNSSPHYHTPLDLVGPSYNSPELARGAAKIAAGTVATLATPLPVAIGHSRLPDTALPGPYRVLAEIVSQQPLEPDSLIVAWATDSGGGTLALVPAGVPDQYEAWIPAVPSGSRVRYHLEAADVAGNTVTSPREWPAIEHSFYVGEPTVVFADDFEAGHGWTVGDPGDDATSGIWLRADPVGTSELGLQYQPEDDHTPGAGTHCFVTGNAAPGLPVGANDVDGGRTTLLSPVLDLSGWSGARLEYYRWYVNDTWGAPPTDVWSVDVSSDAGASWIPLESLEHSDRVWRKIERDLAYYIQPTSQVRFRFIASDDEPGSIVEAAVDDFALRVFAASGTDVPGVVGATAGLALGPGFPNPSGSGARIRFFVPAPGREVTLRLVDVAGRVVATLLDGEIVSGPRDVRWDGRDDRGRPVASGVYLWRLDAGEESLTRKHVLLR